MKGSHIFNPAALGLLVALLLFSQGDEWWTASGYSILGYIIPLSLILIIPNYKALKSKIALGFFLASVAMILATTQFSLFTIAASILQLNYYFAFIMISEPRTSPYKPRQQILFGAAAAIVAYAINLYLVNYSLLLSLLALNMIYALWKFR